MEKIVQAIILMVIAWVLSILANVIYGLGVEYLEFEPVSRSFIFAVVLGWIGAYILYDEQEELE